MLVRDRKGDGAAVDGAEHRSDEPVERGLERSADVALGDDQGRDDGPEALRERKGLSQAARLDAVMRRACTAFGPWRRGSRQPLTASVLARRHSPACPLT